MKVVFKLTNEQAKVANSVAAQVNNDVSVDPADIYCGNLLGYMYNHQNFNPNQRLQFNEDAATVEYHGERHPMIQDGAYNVLVEISGGDIKKLRVVHYETSDKRLQWHETLDSYLYSRAPLEETIKNLEVITSKFNFMWDFVYQPEDREVFATSIAEYTHRHGVMKNHILMAIDHQDRRLAAELNKDQMALLRAIRGAYVK